MHDKQKKSIWGILGAVLLTFILLPIFGCSQAYAASSLAVTKIDYDALTMTIKTNGDTKVFFAKTATTSTWDEVPGAIASNSIDMDISWVPITSNYSFYIKGDVSTTPLKIVLPARTTKFKAKLDIANYKFTFTGVPENASVYWRRAVTSTWKLYNESEIKNTIEAIRQKGASLYFCTSAVNGTSETNTGSRPSKEYLCKVSAASSAPSVGIDYSALTFKGVKTTMEYRLTNENGAWTTVPSTTLELDTVLPKILYSAYKAAVEQGTMEEGEELSVDFRIKGTTTKFPSHIRTVRVKPQNGTYVDEDMDDNTKNFAVFSYVGSQRCRITFTKITIEDEFEDGKKVTLDVPSSKNVYEYTVVNKGEELDVKTAKWSSITSATANFTKEKVPDESELYLRKKATSTVLATEAVKIATMDYPEDAEVETLTTLEKLQGVKKDLTFTVTSTDKDAKVSSVKFNDTAVTIKQSEAVEVEGKYQITVTITDTAAVEKKEENLGVALYAEIALNNDEKVISDATSGVKLTITKAATVTKKAYETYRARNCEEDIVMEILLNDTAKATQQGFGVSRVLYNSKELTKDTDYTVSAVDTEKESITVTISKDKLPSLEAKLTANQFDTAYNIDIELTNEELLTAATLKFKSPVVVSGGTGMCLSLTDYELYKTVSDEKAPEIPVGKVTYTVDSGLAKETPYYFESLKWRDQDVCGSLNTSGDTFTVTVSNEKLYNICKGVGDTPGLGAGTAYLELTLTSSLTDPNAEKLTVLYGYYISVIN